MSAVNVIVGPTVPVTPPTVDAVADVASYIAHNMPTLRNTQTANLLRLCAVSMPVALDGANMPVGLQIMAPLDEDEYALAVALAFERTLGTARERFGPPPLLQ